MADVTASFSSASNAIASGSAPKPRANANLESVKATAQDFEAFFVSQILESMFAGIKTDGPFGGGQGEMVFRSLMLQEYGKVLAERGGFGLADGVVRDMLKLQEVK